MTADEILAWATGLLWLVATGLLGMGVRRIFVVTGEWLEFMRSASGILARVETAVDETYALHTVRDPNSTFQVEGVIQAQLESLKAERRIEALLQAVFEMTLLLVTLLPDDQMPLVRDIEKQLREELLSG